MSKLFKIGFVFIAVCIGMLANNRAAMRAIFLKPTDFATTYGAIISSETKMSTGRGTSYQYKIHYQYTVQGVGYQSYQVSFGSWGSKDPAFADGYVAKYPAGAQVVVYYLPSEPSFSVLEPAVTSATYFYFWFTLGMGGFGALLLAIGVFVAVRSR